MFVFYHPDIENDTITLSAEESRHCVKALRHRVGDKILLTDGRGVMAEAVLLAADMSACSVNIVKRTSVPERRLRLHLAVAPTKNSDRMEWLVEKSVEIGVEKISFIICEHSERPKMDLARMQRIAVSALKQSQTTLLPFMEMIDFEEFQQKYANTVRYKYIAWCDDENTVQLVNERVGEGELVLLIGPEGDFSSKEIDICKSLNYKEIKLGSRRLRTETAALYGCCAVAAMNEKQD